MVKRRKRTVKESGAETRKKERVFKKPDLKIIDDVIPETTSSSRTIIFGVITVGILLSLIFFVIVPLFSTSDDETEPVSAPAAVSVLNGCGIIGIAGQMTEFLAANNITVVNTDNADNSQYVETIVIAKDSLGVNAKNVAELIGVRNITYDFDPGSAANVILILGRDYKMFQPYRDPQ